MEMLDLKSQKVIGGVGAILYVLGALPNVGFALRLVGSILLLVSIYELAQKFALKKIFSNFLTGFIIHIVGIGVALVAAILAGVGTFIKSSLYGYFPYPFWTLYNLGVSLLIPLLILYLCVAAGVYFYKESLSELSLKSGVPGFKTAGDLLFYGAITTIIVVGIFVMLAGWVVLSISFFSLPDKVEIQPSEPSSSSM
ncbi:MAG TPA: DUF996 domain-containing protein [Candidatus Hydrothermia bacterium]|nr:DUF996 domain-containing protein [Candidatus Hydrothermia bacterium]